MAKELPYFRFYPSEWLEGDITLEKDKTQSLFVQIVCWYWKKDCQINLGFIQKRLIKNKATLKQCLNDLIKTEIIKVNDNNDIIIEFLDEQYDLLSEKRQKHIDSGRLGGKKKANNAKATLKHRSTYKEKKYKNKDKEVNKDALPQFKIWLDYRKSINKLITNKSTLGLLVKRFNVEPIEKIKWVVNHSIENNYQGLFWDKYKEDPTKVKPQKSTGRYYCPECKKYEDYKGDTMKYNYTHSCGKPLEFIDIIKELK
ncbi:MAG: hypothetical protein KAS32_04080 [Candidatus Peribacteraceae bacterium]|nr:hypothetical protein [Candidatus Peribacteraceae bacterium]